jgi:hypothetical protein
MYSRDQVSQLKEEFWTSFGQYMSLLPATDGRKINWINYKTGLKYVYFKMHADKHSASIAIEIVHPDLGIQELILEQFRELKVILQGCLEESWDWSLHTTDEYGKTISRIYKDFPGVSIFKKEDWPELISFFKPRMIALNEFWEDAQYSFEVFK